ncbi:hypothetical protein JW707_00490 [Candidatus Woesearchaeota archaeon]|nr:hypothetical protein [Candidatus Woesearchaeota archaeon]
MKKAFLLSKANPAIGKEEILALAGTKKFEMQEDLLVLDADFDFERLAYTKSVYDLLFECTKKQLIGKMKSFNWQKIYKKSFCLRIFGEDKSREKDFAGYIWGNLKKPKVDLEKAGTNIHIFFTKKKVMVCLLDKKINQSGFESRRAHLRPEMHPSSLHPRLARAMVNLTGIKTGTVTDPFCGTGGILIEAGLMGFNVEGYDIEQSMLLMAEKNLQHFKIRHKLEKKDATAIKKKIGYVVSDLPYAKSTRKQNLEVLYSKFFSILKKNLHKKAVLGLPDFVDNRKLIKKAGLKVENEFNYYLHKSLSKKIFVVVK